MSRATGIEWTDATWNPIRGCSRVSEGCRHCYAETVANRFCGPGSPYEGLVQLGADGKGNGKWNGQIRFVEKRLLDPLKWALHAAEGKAPLKIFVNSMSDLFHENVTDEMLDRIFAVMALCPQHTFQVLAKRALRARDYLNALSEGRRNVATAGARIISGVSDIELRVYGEAHDRMLKLQHTYFPGPLPNVWLGVSVENQKAADERIPLLLQTPAAVRFISAEPLLGPVDLAPFVGLRCDHDDSYAEEDTGATVCRQCDETAFLNWVIVGGESGPGARPMHPDWARNLRDQCRAAGVPFFFKQWGEWLGAMQDGALLDGNQHINCCDESVRVGKKAAGHLLDGEVIQQFPGVRG